MRLVTKAILLLSLVALGVFCIWVAGQRGTGRLKVGELFEPRPAAADGQGRFFDDPIGHLRERLTQSRQGTGRGQPAAPTEHPHAEPRDLDSTAEDEGTVLVLEHPESVLGADPPGPSLKPEGVQGMLVSSRWKRAGGGQEALYEVKPGDTLYDIAASRYGDPRYVRLIEAANPGLDPQRLRIGDRLVMPDVAETSEAPAAPQPKVYEVRRNDTLIGIARRFYGDASMYRKIYEANRDVLSSPNATLRIGQRLRLPEF